MMLSPRPGEDARCEWAQQILTEISAAFGHVFSLLQGRTDSPLADQTLEACQSCQAVFVYNAADPALRVLCDEFNLPMLTRLCDLPLALCGRHESPIRMALSQVLSLDGDTRRAAARQAEALAQEEEALLCHVPPSGASAAAWTQDMPGEALNAPEAMRQLILSPNDLGLCLCPPYAGGMLFSAALALYGDSSLLCDMAWEDGFGVYAPCLAPVSSVRADRDACAAALAVACLLRHSLGLVREADCVNATLQNALSAGEKAPQDTVDLICEQISIAGALAGRGLKG